jgi:hypothetical protein
MVQVGKTRKSSRLGSVQNFYAGFSDYASVVPILSQAGFFDRFEVKFNKPKDVDCARETSSQVLFWNSFQFLDA